MMYTPRLLGKHFLARGTRDAFLVVILCVIVSLWIYAGFLRTRYESTNGDRPAILGDTKFYATRKSEVAVDVLPEDRRLMRLYEVALHRHGLTPVRASSSAVGQPPETLNRLCDALTSNRILCLSSSQHKTVKDDTYRPGAVPCVSKLNFKEYTARERMWILKQSRPVRKILLLNQTFGSDTDKSVFGSNSDNDAHVQLYVNDTMKLSGIPFSIRVIVLVSSVIPLRAYIYQHGIIHYRTDKDFSKDCSIHLDTEMLWFYIRHHYNAAAEAYVKTAIADSVFWTLDGSVSAFSPNTHSPPAPCKRCYQLLAYDILLNSAQLHPVVISVHNESEVFSDCQQPRYILRKQALLNEMVDIILDKPTRTPMFSDLRPLCNEGSARWSNSKDCRHTLRERAGDLVWKPNATYCSQERSDGMTIQALHIYPGKLTPPFHPAIFKYTMQLEYEKSVVEVLAIPVYCGATVVTSYGEDATWPFNWAVGAGQANLEINGRLDKRRSLKYRISTTRKYLFETENPSSHKVSPHDVCSLVQDCNYIFDKSQACGLGETKYRDWDEMEFAISRLPLCTTGYAPGRWLVPCGSCYDRQSCYWPKAVWQPYDCRYMDLNKKNIQACLAGRTILFQGDSILRGIFDYMHGALKLKKGTGNASGQHIYVTTSNKGKKVAIQYSRILAYEEDDVVDIPRYFNSEFDKLLSTGGKIENTKNTIFALGGAYWMQPAIYKWFMGRLDNAGLTNVTVVIKMDNAALHHPQIKTPTLWDPVRHLKRNLAVAHMIESEKQRSQNVKLVNPINITMPMFQGFHDGGFCSCHFHKYHLNATYAVDGHVQKMYIKPFFHTLCLGETDRRS